MKKEPIHFEKDIAPTTKEIFKERIKASGYVEKMNVRFYSGQERDLKVRAYVKNKGTGIGESLVSFAENTDNTLSGNDDYFQYEMFVKVQNDDQLIIEVENTNTDTTVGDYTLMVDVLIVYAAEEKGVRE